MKKKSTKSAGLSAISTDDAKRYRAEEAMRTMLRASEHMKDKALMRDVRRLAKEHSAALSKVGK
jgi:putative N-acetylmannosamine-6-phosphate epimerase